ncbi:MAG: PH domain-containing protein [Desulfovibrio sp.]|jgi:hypothetical protein|nr:PH domain-containing protein [Desulfovibrio sp.]
MQDEKAVAAKVAELGGSKMQFVGKELKALPEILREGENLLAVASGQMDNHTHLVVVTNARLLAIFKGIVGQSDFEIPIADVRGVNVKSGILMADLVIDAGGQIKKLTQVDKELAQKVAQTFSHMRSGEKLSATTPETPPTPETARSESKAMPPTGQRQQPVQKKKFSRWLKVVVAIFIFGVIVSIVGKNNEKKTTPTASAPQIQTLPPKDEMAKKIKKMDSQIQSVDVQEIQGVGLAPVIVFRAEPSPDELLQESEDMMDVAKEITRANGSEMFGGIFFRLTIPMVDKFNNKTDVHGLDLFWSMSTLKKINWSGFQNWQFLNVVDRITRGQQGNAVLQSYCGKRQSYSLDFCRKAGL